jgi:purine-binding chemotaxis protein CheW
MPNLVARREESGRRGTQQGPVREFLAFVLASELYGVELARIKEIVSPPPVTWVPRARGDILGVCSVRGLLVTVVDLKRRLRLPERSATRRSRLLLTEAETGEVLGLLVDEVRQVMRLTETEIESASSVLGADISEHVLGIGRPSGDKNVIILLDLGSIVAG